MFSKLLKTLANARQFLWPRPDQGFEFEPSTGILLIDGETVTLRPKTAALLTTLLSEPDEVHSKEELLDRVWPNLAVQEQAVFQCVNEIRSAFGSKACVRTRPGEGYQWVGIARTPRKRLLQLTRPTQVLDIAPAALVSAVVCGVLVLTTPNPDRTSVPRIAVMPTHTLSDQPRDRDLSLGFMSRLQQRTAAISGTQTLPIDTVLRVVSSDELGADLVVHVTIEREEVLLKAEFAIEGTAGVITGAYESFSEAWLADQIASEVEDAVRYSLLPNKSTPARLERHQALSKARGLFFSGKHEQAASLVAFAAADRDYLSASYFAFANTMALGQMPSVAKLHELLSAANEQSDYLNLVRGHLLLAKQASAQGQERGAADYALEGRKMAESYGYGSLSAALEIHRGKALSRAGSLQDAIAALEGAAMRYTELNCVINQHSAYMHLHHAYRAARNTAKADEMKSMITALETLHPYMESSTT